MSHQVQIDYEAIAIRCESICEVAERQIAELDQILSDIENGSQSLHNSQTETLRQSLVEERDSLAGKIENLKSQAKEVTKKGVVSGDSDRLRLNSADNVDKAVQELQNQVNELALRD